METDPVVAWLGLRRSLRWTRVARSTRTGHLMHPGQSVGPAFVGGEATSGLGAAGHRLGGRLRIEDVDLAGRVDRRGTVRVVVAHATSLLGWIGLTGPLRV
jgi:hypothetical protein